LTQKQVSVACGWRPRRAEWLEKGLSPIVASELATMCNVLRKPIQYFLPTDADTVLGECLADPLFNETMMFWVRMTPKERNAMRAMAEAVVDGG
jgi:hypothetical protein